ncbi:hypothetical protein DRQ16_02465 [bacterium]|nr:MAG: hypothetical protein DRQ16_02465 [bacterium]
MIKRLVACLIVFAACNPLPHAAGRRDQVVVVAPDGAPEKLYEVAESLLARSLFLPSREEVFEVIRAGPRDLEHFKFWRNLLLLGWRGTYLDTVLSDSAWGNVKTSELFEEKNLWINGQEVLVLAGKDEENTLKGLRKWGERIYYTIRYRERERLEYVLYRDGENKELTEKMRKMYGVWFKVPQGYRLSVMDRNIISFIRQYPARLVTLYFEEGTREWDPLKKRDEVFEIYFEGDKVLRDPKYLSFEETEIGGIPALRIIGVWQNEEKVMGGPFILYYFKDGVRTYILDGHVFSPDKKKWPYMEEVDIILHTFEREYE